jgi:hypothetical protein
MLMTMMPLITMAERADSDTTTDVAFAPRDPESESVPDGWLLLVTVASA